jgi:hypothetical protein
MAEKYWISTSSTSFSTAANWSDNAAPADGDTLWFNSLGTANVETDLDASALDTLVINIEKGAPSIGTSATALTIDGGTVNLIRDDNNSAAWPTLVRIANSSTNALTVNVGDSASQSSDGVYPPVQLNGAAITLNATGGYVGVGVRPGQTATLASLRTVQGSSAPTIDLGAAVTITDAVLTAGTVYSISASTATAVRVNGADYRIDGNAAHTTLNVDKGTVTWNGTGTITTLNLRGTFDASQNPRARTITTVNTYRGAVLKLDNGVAGGITVTNAINHYDGIGGSGASITFPPNTKGTYAAI